MKTNLIKETPVYHYEGCCPEFGQSICLYADDLKCANIGDTWSCEDQDKYPNRSREWEVSVTIIYKNEYGVALLEQNDNEPELLWVELH